MATDRQPDRDQTRLSRSVDIEVDNPMQAQERILEYRISLLNKEIIRLKQKCGEQITLEEITHGFGEPAHHFRIVRSKRYG